MRRIWLGRFFAPGKGSAEAANPVKPLICAGEALGGQGREPAFTESTVNMQRVKAMLQVGTDITHNSFTLIMD